MPSKISKETLRVVFRKRPDGELIALFVDEPGDPEGTLCVGFAQAGKHNPVDPAVVMANTKPAKPAEYTMLEGLLLAEPYEYVLEVVAKVPADAVKLRVEKKDEYARFKRVGHLY